MSHSLELSHSRHSSVSEKTEGQSDSSDCLEESHMLMCRLFPLALQHLSLCVISFLIFGSIVLVFVYHLSLSHTKRECKHLSHSGLGLIAVVGTSAPTKRK